MQPAYGEFINTEVFWYYLFSICIIAAGTCSIVYIWCTHSRDKQLLHSIIGSINETTVIYDRQNRPCFINISFERDKMLEFLQRIDAVIKESGYISETLKKNNLHKNTVKVLEGEMQPFTKMDTIFYWKMCPLVRNRKYMGRILVFSDITQYKKLYAQLDEKNRQLKYALKTQREYVVIAKRLVAEEERERIMNLVNHIADEYLKQLEECIRKMKEYSNGNTNEDRDRFAAENDAMIQATRDTISKIRETAKVLHVSV